MNTLTPNRILQKGDEYRDNGTWKPVPTNDYGLQVQFTDYKEVRRPSEKPFQAISPDSARPASSKVVPAAKAESEKTPVPTHSGTGASLSSTPAQIDETTRLAHAVAHLPTIVSRKAHANPAQETTSRNLAKVTALRETPETVRPTEVPERVASPTPSTGGAITRIKFPPASGSIWTGRNGTFVGYGMELMKANDIIMLSPIGKRGVGNCTIQFPKAVIPQLIDFLQKQI